MVTRGISGHILAVLIGLCWGLTSPLFADSSSEYIEAAIPTPPFPKPYENCVIYPQSQSPDHKYGFLYPAHSVVFDLDKVDMFLVTLKPFGIVAQMPDYEGHVALSSSGYFLANWANDSSAVVMMYGGKWGPESVYLVPIHGGKVGKIVDLTAEIIKLADPNFKKSKAEKFNDELDFLFDDGDHVQIDDQNNLVRDSGWTINARNQVIINCTLASNPKHDPEIKSWAGTVTGLWDITQGKFVSVKFTRTFRGEYKE